MSQPAAIRVLVVDDHVAVRLGVRTIINDTPGMTVVGEAPTAADGIALFRSQRPDVTLVDLKLPDMRGADLIARLRAEFPDGVFIVLTTYYGDEDIHRAIKAGARGYLLKDTSAADLVNAIRQAQTDELQLPPTVAQRLAARPARELSSRELEVLEMIAKGATNREIATTLGISDSTVKAHVASIMNKLDATDRTMAATQAIRRGLVRL
jgi:two-component system, NarL family, response regulator